MRVTLCDSCGKQLDEDVSYILLLKKLKTGLFMEDVIREELCEDCVKEVMRTLDGNDC